MARFAATPLPRIPSLWFVILPALILVSVAALADSTDTTPATSYLTFSVSGMIQLNTPAPGNSGGAYAIAQQGKINDINQARILVNELSAVIRQGDPACNAGKSSFLINLIYFDASKGDQPGLKTGIVQSSRWYVYEANQANFAEATSQTARVYGSTNPYVITIHANVQYIPSTPPPLPGYTMDYSYKTAHRTAANWQDVQDALVLFQKLTQKPAAAGPGAPPPTKGTFWAWDQMNVQTPANITIAAAVLPPGATTAVSLDSKPVIFNDEGFYHWDVSVGVPITSYTQIQSVLPQSGTASPVPANVDKRNLLLLGDVYIHPVDLSGAKISYIPYPVFGASFASQPLHGLMGGAGIGAATAALYVGCMIVTSDLPNKTTTRHIKLAFGLNLPIRTIMGKLGINTQISSGK